MMSYSAQKKDNNHKNNKYHLTFVTLFVWIKPYYCVINLVRFLISIYLSDIFSNLKKAFVRFFPCAKCQVNAIYFTNTKKHRTHNKKWLWHSFVIEKWADIKFHINGALTIHKRFECVTYIVQCTWCERLCAEEKGNCTWLSSYLSSIK